MEHLLHHTGQRWMCSHCGRVVERLFGKERVIAEGDASAEHGYGVPIPYIPRTQVEQLPFPFRNFFERQPDEGWIV